MSEKPQVEFFFSFRSPYSYLAAERAFALADKWDIALIYQGVRPMVTRGVPLPSSKKLYILRDAEREARRLGIPFGNMHDPLGEGALRCLRVGELAKDQGKERTFVTRTARAIWSGAADVTRDEVLRPLCEGAGLAWDECREALKSEALLQRCEQNVERLRSYGQWGVPTFVFKGEPFWGQDRIEDLERVLEDAGVARK